MNFWANDAAPSTPTTTGSGTPDWLQTNDEEAAASGGFAADLEKVTSDEPAEDSPTNKKKKRKSSTTRDTSAGDDSPSRPPLCSCRTIFLLLVSGIFMALWIYSAIVQNNDLQGIQWIVFYSLHASLAATFMVYWLCCFPEKVLYLLAAAMSVWSIVYVIIASIQLSKTDKGGADTENGRSEFEDIAYELGGACVALLSALYHGCMAKYCIKTGK